jgi:hypothetical protein
MRGEQMATKRAEEAATTGMQQQMVMKELAKQRVNGAIDDLERRGGVSGVAQSQTARLAADANAYDQGNADDAAETGKAIGVPGAEAVGSSSAVGRISPADLAALGIGNTVQELQDGSRALSTDLEDLRYLAGQLAQAQTFNQKAAAFSGQRHRRAGQLTSMVGQQALKLGTAGLTAPNVGMTGLIGA